MAVSITNESKNTVAVTNADKGANLTWDEANFSWDNAAGTFGTQRIVFVKESKNNISITNESKT